MNISIFGLGYVGAVSAACLAKSGHHVIGVDTDTKKIDAINRGDTTIVEPHLKAITQDVVNSGHLRGVLDGCKAVMTTDTSFICVGTPSKQNNQIDLGYVKNVCKLIGTALKNKNERHVVVCRSTMFPGSIRNVVIPTLEKYSGKTAGVEFSVCINPEFLKEGSAVHDFFNPSQNIVGSTDKVGFHTINTINASYSQVKSTEMNIEVVEMLKYSYNIWHALKVCFTNEIGNVCKNLGIDSHQLMNVFCEDKVLNLSPYYLKPGFAFGGSCLPKDLRAFLYESKQLNIELPILNSILPSNQLQIENLIKTITSYSKRNIGILGISFKPNTDDLRESPMIQVAERLLGKGYQIQIYDENLSKTHFEDIPHDYLNYQLTHVSKLLSKKIDNVLDHSEILIISHHTDELLSKLNSIKKNTIVIDLVNINHQFDSSITYHGLCW